MNTIAIVGAGPALGMSLARRFGGEGFQVGLIARRRAQLDSFVDELGRDGIRAAAFPADVTRRTELSDALLRVQRDLGPVDVLSYSPTPDADSLADAASLTVDNVQHQIDYSLLGAVAAVEVVLPGMMERGDGALLFTGGLSAKIPVPSHANAGVALAAQRNLAYVLNLGLADAGIYAGTITVAGIITGSTAGELIAGFVENASALAPLLVDPNAIADLYWDMVTKRDRVEEVVGSPEAVEAAEWR